MRIRCVQCTTLIPVPPAGDPNPLATCPGCGRRYRVTVRTPPPARELERYRRARDFARANKISEANAYSILEGLMTLEEARSLNDAHPSLPATIGRRSHEVATALDDPEADWEYDSGFDAAVRHGHLTARQAAERGDRAALARKVSERHRIPMHLALMVADNRMSVGQALGARGSGDAAAPAPRERSAGLRPFLMVLIVIAITTWILLRPQAEIAAVGTGGLSRRLATAALPAREPAPSEAATTHDPHRTTERIDSTGQLVEVTGPDPRNVLMAYCEAGAGTRRAIEILPAVPPNSGLRYGLFQSLAHENSQRIIPIRKDAATGRWVAGNGRAPIVSMVPPLQPSGTRGVSVSGE